MVGIILMINNDATKVLKLSSRPLTKFFHVTIVTDENRLADRIYLATFASFHAAVCLPFHRFCLGYPQ